MASVTSRDLFPSANETEFGGRGGTECSATIGGGREGRGGETGDKEKRRQ